jgi:hypothetical protein
VEFAAAGARVVAVLLWMYDSVVFLLVDSASTDAMCGEQMRPRSFRRAGWRSATRPRCDASSHSNLRSSSRPVAAVMEAREQWVLAVGMLWATALTMLIPVAAPMLYMLVILRVVIGVGESVFFPASMQRTRLRWERHR